MTDTSQIKFAGARSGAVARAILGLQNPSMIFFAHRASAGAAEISRCAPGSTRSPRTNSG
jgi:hypothetical protein